jgi:hypothetical protein
MMKKGGTFITSWRRRYFVLRANKEIQYFEHHEDAADLEEMLTKGKDGNFLSGRGSPQGTFDVSDVFQVQVCPPDPSEPESKFGFTVSTKQRVWVFWASSNADRDVWITLITRFMTPIAAFKMRKEGQLIKQGGFVHNWKRRWFAVGPTTMFYFEDQATCAMFKVQAAGLSTNDPIPSHLQKLALGVSCVCLCVCVYVCVRVCACLFVSFCVFFLV